MYRFLRQNRLLIIKKIKQTNKVTIKYPIKQNTL